MSGNLKKSEAGWVRLRARVAAREGVRAAQMDHRVHPRPEPVKVEEEDGTQTTFFVVRKGSRRHLAFSPQNSRYA